MSALSLSTVNKYIKFRQDNKPLKVIELCHHAIRFTDTSNTTTEGKEAFYSYLCKPVPESKWEMPVVLDNGTIRVKGQVSKMWMWWDVSAYFVIDEEERIKSITLMRE